jgi:hypothetical protein
MNRLPGEDSALVSFYLTSRGFHARFFPQIVQSQAEQPFATPRVLYPIRLKRAHNGRSRRAAALLAGPVNLSETLQHFFLNKKTLLEEAMPSPEQPASSAPLPEREPWHKGMSKRQEEMGEKLHQERVGRYHQIHELRAKKVGKRLRNASLGRTMTLRSRDCTSSRRIRSGMYWAGVTSPSSSVTAIM